MPSVAAEDDGNRPEQRTSNILRRIWLILRRRLDESGKSRTGEGGARGLGCIDGAKLGGKECVLPSCTRATVTNGSP
jgi:hypothetical protein